MTNEGAVAILDAHESRGDAVTTSKAFRFTLLIAAGASAFLSASQASAASFFFSTGNPDGLMATASRPGPSSGVNQETEAADDFVLTDPTSLTSATFAGLIPTGVALSDVAEVRVEIYRIFPVDSNTARTSGPPTFSTSQVPTRVNSPSDVEFADRDSAVPNLTFTPAVISPSFSVANSVDTGIHPTPNQTTGGDGQVSGQEVGFNVTFTTPLQLPADHYFFVPQILLANPDKHFLWLSAPKPIVSPGTPFPSGTTDLQEWIRNASLEPDWLRVGTDIVGNVTFNATFSLTGSTITATTFASSSARSTKRGVLLRWRTASEASLLGFRVYRMRSGQYRPVSPTLVPAKGAVAGAPYRYVDAKAPRRGLLRYRIQMIDRDGSRSWFGRPLVVPR